MIRRRLFLTGMTALLLTRTARADQPMIFAANGQAIGGYDVVAYFTDGRPVPGRAQFSVMWKGAMWQFASAEHLELFEANPRAFAPRYGGYCAYGMTRGSLVPTQPDAFVIHQGRLYLIHNRDVIQIWQADIAGNVALANGNWPKALGK